MGAHQSSLRSREKTDEKGTTRFRTRNGTAPRKKRVMTDEHGKPVVLLPPGLSSARDEEPGWNEDVESEG